MKQPQVTVVCVGVFHLFTTAQQLNRHGMLNRICTTIPKFKLNRFNIPPEKLLTRTHLRLPQTAMGMLGLLSEEQLLEFWHWIDVDLDRAVAKEVGKEDVVFAMASNGLDSGKRAKALGKGFIVDRPCAHKLTQLRLLTEESKKFDIYYPGMPDENVRRELEEYALADKITVASEFSMRSFREHGFEDSKLVKIPYGVNLSQFYPVATPPEDEFRVLFVGQIGLQKGVQYLFQAFRKLNHKKKRLTLCGQVSPELRVMVDDQLQYGDVVETGPVSKDFLREEYSKSHVFVLPSIQDGFGMVMGEAMACGTPVICTTNTGAEDMVTEGVDGYIIPIRDVEALTDRMQHLADHPEVRAKLSAAALEKVKLRGGWDDYGDQVAALVREVC